MPAISDAQRQALAELAPVLPKDAYLAGGVAVAAWFHHRESRDLDIFSKSDPVTSTEALSAYGVIESVADGTLELTVRGVRVSCLRYRPALLETPRDIGWGVSVATPVDLGCMKLSAIAQRGAARDFWDLHVILGGGAELESLLSAFIRKYPKVDVGHVVRSLAYFGDADGAPLPAGLDEATWSSICEAFRDRVRRL